MPRRLLASCAPDSMSQQQMHVLRVLCVLVLHLLLRTYVDALVGKPAASVLQVQEILLLSS